MTQIEVYQTLQTALQNVVRQHQLTGQPVKIRCKALSAEEAIGKPKHDDYPIITGKEIMIEADFQGAKGQAFTDEVEQADYRVEDLLSLPLDSNRQRASFVAGLNAIFRRLGLCEKTVHCKDDEPLLCADNLVQAEAIPQAPKILLIGFQPRFFDALASSSVVELRCIDLDNNNIDRTVSGVTVEAPEATGEALNWCDLVFATGSTLVNGSITTFLNQDKPVYFYGITISAAATILNLPVYCHCGH